jgi:hypothetical protein
MPAMRREATTRARHETDSLEVWAASGGGRPETAKYCLLEMSTGTVDQCGTSPNEGREERIRRHLEQNSTPRR